jgi:hypothetical protein
VGGGGGGGGTSITKTLSVSPGKLDFCRKQLKNDESVQFDTTVGANSKNL